MSQSQVMDILREYGPLTAFQIAEAIDPDYPPGKDPSTVRRNIGALRRYGMIEVIEPPEDGDGRRRYRLVERWRAL